MVKNQSNKPKKMANGGTTKSCWKGYEKKGTKVLKGRTVNNCVKK